MPVWMYGFMIQNGGVNQRLPLILLLSREEENDHIQIQMVADFVESVSKQNFSHDI